MAEHHGTWGMKDGQMWPLSHLHRTRSVHASHLESTTFNLLCRGLIMALSLEHPCFSLHVEVTIVHISESPQPELTFAPSNLPNQGPKPEMVECCMLTWAMTGPSKRLSYSIHLSFFPILPNSESGGGGGQGRNPRLYLFTDDSRQGAQGVRPWLQRGEVAATLNEVGSFYNYTGLCGLSMCWIQMLFDMSLNFLLLKSMSIKVMDRSKYIFRGICPLNKCEWAGETKSNCSVISYHTSSLFKVQVSVPEHLMCISLTDSSISNLQYGFSGHFPPLTSRL